MEEIGDCTIFPPLSQGVIVRIQQIVFYVFLPTREVRKLLIAPETLSEMAEVMLLKKGEVVKDEEIVNLVFAFAKEAAKKISNAK